MQLRDGANPCNKGGKPQENEKRLPMYRKFPIRYETLKQAVVTPTTIKTTVESSFKNDYDSVFFIFRWIGKVKLKLTTLPLILVLRADVTSKNIGFSRGFSSGLFSFPCWAMFYE